MADLDDLREGANFNATIKAETKSYFLKGLEHTDWGIKDRMSRIFNEKSGRTLMLAFDHGYIMGPTSGLERIDLDIVPLMEHADSLMCTRGVLRSMVPPTVNKPIALRYSAGTTILTDLNNECLLDIDDAIRCNASSLAVMVSIGGTYEAQTIRNLVKTADLGTKYGIPSMGVTAVGTDMVRDARYFSLASRVCAENGATYVKTYFCEGFEKVAAACPVPIIVAGGKKLPELEALELAYNAIQQGAAGVDMGRNVFQSDAPIAMIKAVKSVIHDDVSPKEAYEMFLELKNS